MFFFLEFGERIGKRIIKNREEALLEAFMRERFLSSKGEAISAALVGKFWWSRKEEVPPVFQVYFD